LTWAVHYATCTARFMTWVGRAGAALKFLLTLVYVIWWWSSVLAYTISPCWLLRNHYTRKVGDACVEWQDYLGLGKVRYFDKATIVFLLCFLPHSSCATKEKGWLLHSFGTVSLLVSFLPVLTALPFGVDKLAEGFYELGIVSGRATAVFTGMLLLAISRQSVLSENHSMGYIDLITFHRTAGWWTVAWTAIHALAFITFFLLNGGMGDLLQEMFPVQVTCHHKHHKHHKQRSCLNIGGLVNFFGLLATLSAVALGVLSLERVRRKRYESFYFTHLVSSFLFIVLGGMHFFMVILLAIPGLVLYMYDKLINIRYPIGSPDSQVICPEVVLLSWKARAPPKLSPGSRWVYLCAENLSAVQWHPFSVIQSGDRMHVMVKASGDWSRSLCETVASGAPLQVKLEGPYGTPVHSWTQQSPRALFLVAGGVGIVPYVDLLLGSSPGLTARKSKTTLLWAIRGPEYHGMKSVLDLHSLSRTADISVFITSDALTTEVPMAQQLVSAAACEPPPHYGWVGAQGFLTSTVIVFATRGVLSVLEPLLNNTTSYASLSEWASMARAVPVFLGAAAVAVSSASLFLAVWFAGALCSKHRCARDPLVGQIVGAEVRMSLVEQPGSLALHYQRPDIYKCLQEVAKLGPVDLRACGPEQLLQAAAGAARKLRKQGLDVRVELESAL